MLWKFLEGLDITAHTCSPPPPPANSSILLYLQQTYSAHYRIWEKPQTYNNVINILKSCQFLDWNANVQNVPFFGKNGHFEGWGKILFYKTECKKCGESHTMGGEVNHNGFYRGGAPPE
jgi:hypothetical protein